VRLAKQHLDVGLFTNRPDAMLAFWQREVGLPFEEALPTGGGNMQHRHGLNGGILKLNHSREPLAEESPSGYARLLVASEAVTAPKDLVDPDGNAVALVPPGYRGITAAGIEIAVNSLPRALAYYRGALGWEEAGEGIVRCGQTILFLSEQPGRARSGAMRAKGFRYLTVQVWDADSEYEAVVAAGGEGALAPRTLGSVARFGFVRDPDGNWLETSQRASLTGALPPNA